MFRILLRVLAVAGLASAIGAKPAAAQLRTFDRPRHEGADVSYCGADGSSCGEGMATAWCRTVGYEFARDWAARAGTDAASRAVRLDDGAVCEGAACESFATITCGREGGSFPMPVLGGAATNATVLSPDLRQTELALDAAEYAVLMPGCGQTDPGAFACDSIIEYQHCRTLMVSEMVNSCRADLAFEGGLAVPRAAAPGDYELVVDSDATVRVTLGDRRFGRIRGEAHVELAMRVPTENESAWCLQRDSYVYFPTGPKGGLAEMGEPEDCGEPIEFSFEAHGDDVARAYDLCETFAAWGMEIEDSIEVLAAGLFEIRSASPDFAATHGANRALIAPYVRVEAPLTIECREP
jgi:hypothetical protein